MPERDRLANTLLAVAPLRSDEGRAALLPAGHRNIFSSRVRIRQILLPGLEEAKGCEVRNMQR